MKAGLGLVALWTLLPACAPGPGTNPCRFDVVECREPEGFAIDPNCALDEPLVVELGQGEQGFESLGPGVVPELHYGSQGGLHLFAALRVTNPDAQHALFRARLSYAVTVDVAAPAGDAGFEEASGRELVFEATDATELEGGGIELSSVLLRLPYDPSEQGDTNRLELVVEDSCGRRGAQIHEFTW